MTNLAILEITDGTTTVSLIDGPFYLAGWRPAIPDYKGGGTFVDPPMADGRRIVYKKFDNTTERFDLKHRAESVDEAAEDVRSLQLLLQKAANYWISGETTDPVYLAARAYKETNTRYATIVYGRMPELENPYSQPFLQQDCAVVQDNLTLLIEHAMWRDSVPGTYSTVDITPVTREHNLIKEGNFERGHYSYSYWSDFNSPTEWQTGTSRVHSGMYSMRIIATSGATKGIYQDVTGLESGEDYTITAYAFPTAGSGELIAYDGGGFTNAVTDNTIDVDEEQITNQSFETDTSGWNNDGWDTFSRSNTQADAGSWSLRLVKNVDSGTNAVVARAYSSLIPLNDNTQHVSYEFSAYIDTAQSSPADIVRLGMFVEWYDDDGQRASSSLAPFRKVKYMSGAPSDWYRYKMNSEKPVGATQCRVGIGVFRSSNITSIGAAALYFDNVSLKPYVEEGYVVQPDSRNQWFPLSVTKTCPAGGSIRVALATNTSTGGTVFFDDVELVREYGQGDEATDEKIFFANYQGYSNVSHIFRYDNSGASYSSNLLDATLPYNLFPGTTTTDDILYFCSSSDQGGQTPYTSLLFDVSATASATTFAVTWEYRTSGGSWSSLSDVRDETDSFQNPGWNAVTWTLPSDWANDYTLNSITGWWVRARITTLTGTLKIPRVGSHPFIINTPYFEVDSSDILGDVPQRMRYHVFNEGGPIRGSEIIGVTAGTDDVLVETDISSVTTGGSNAAINADDVVVVRFQNVNIPQNARIINARLYFSGVGLSGDVAAKIESEASDNSTAISIYADYSGKSWNTQWAVGWSSDSSDFMFQGSGGYRTGVFDNVVRPVHAVTRRSGWVYGNSLSLRIRYLTGGGSRTFEMYDSYADSWGLEVEWVAAESYTTTLLMGSRLVSRGSDFRAYLSMTDLQPPSITLDTGTNSSFAIYPLSGIFSGTDKAVAINYWTQESGSFADRAIFKIHAPLSNQYVGRFRAFLRAAHDSAASEGSETQFRLRVKTGIGGGFYTGSISLGKLATPELLDMGLITIPNIGAADEITLAVQATRATDVAVYLYDLILIPVDEWVAEFTTPSNLSGGVLDDSAYLDVDSAEKELSPAIRATLRNEKSGAAMAPFVVSGGAATLTPDETQRVWVLASTNLSVDTVGDTVSNSSFLNAVHAVKAYGNSRYITFRGGK